MPSDLDSEIWRSTDVPVSPPFFKTCCSGLILVIHIPYWNLFLAWGMDEVFNLKRVAGGWRWMMLLVIALIGSFGMVVWAENIACGQESVVSEKEIVMDTVQYSGFSGFRSITYESEFFGFSAAVERSFTNYGWDFRPGGDYSLDLSAYQLSAADFNGDGLDEIVGYDPNTGVVTWLERTEPLAELSPFVVSRPRSADRAGIFHEFQWISDNGVFLTGDFNGDGFVDIALAKQDGDGTLLRISFNDGNGNFGEGTTYKVDLTEGQLVSGDFNGDGIFDLCVYDPAEGQLNVFFGAGDGTFSKRVDSRVDIRGGTLIAADFNQSRWWDVAFYNSDANPQGLVFLFGRGDGTFGPRDEEFGTRTEMNLKAWFDMPEKYQSFSVAIGCKMEEFYPAGFAVYDPESQVIHYRLHRGPEAYNYSTHIIWDSEESIYKMWHGARWRTLDVNGQDIGDGDHIAYAYSEDGRKWFREISRPMFYQGIEEGISDWWSLHTMEPEVLKVDGTYYMYYQVMIRPGDKVDTGEVATTPADRILVATSQDGFNWEHKRDRGVVINITRPEATKITHQEVIYVPDDPDGRPWWLYVYHIVDGKGAGHVRIRSNDPTTFDWRRRETVTGMAQIGNQIAYADEAPGGRVFFRITFAQSQGKAVPTLQISRDGRYWTMSKSLLAGSDNDETYKNMYFLGVSTIDGTGKMEYLGDGKFRALYGGTTSVSSVAPGIFKSHIGIGEVIITFNK